MGRALDLDDGGISTHALREEGDNSLGICSSDDRNFYPRPPRGGRPGRCGDPAQAAQEISTHALREEGDRRPKRRTDHFWQFLPTPTARRATGGLFPRFAIWEFLPTPSARRATRQLPRSQEGKAISTHALREEGDGLRAGRELAGVLFLPTPSARRATTTPWRCPACSRHFYPRPPRGGRHSRHCVISSIFRISTHALREEGDARRKSRTPPGSDFYPRPPRGGRPTGWSHPASCRYFYPRPPRGGRPGPMSRSPQ